MKIFVLQQGLPSGVDFSNIYILPEFGPILSFDQVVQEAEKRGFSCPACPRTWSRWDSEVAAAQIPGTAGKLCRVLNFSLLIG